MACDSCWSDNGTVDTLATKIERLKSGALLGTAGCGDSRAITKMLDNVASPDDLPTHDELCEVRSSIVAMIAFPNGRLFKVQTSKDDADDVGAWEISEGFSAIGSGGIPANVAMFCGLSAADAVEVACHFDTLSRGPVHILEIKS